LKRAHLGGYAIEQGGHGNGAGAPDRRAGAARSAPCKIAAPSLVQAKERVSPAHVHLECRRAAQDVVHRGDLQRGSSAPVSHLALAELNR
jgi:hypothetical protein